MTKRDYLAIGDAVREWQKAFQPDPRQFADLVDRLAGVFAQDNPRFDAERWYHYVVTGTDKRTA